MESYKQTLGLTVSQTHDAKSSGSSQTADQRQHWLCNSLQESLSWIWSPVRPDICLWFSINTSLSLTSYNPKTWSTLWSGKAPMMYVSPLSLSSLSLSLYLVCSHTVACKGQYSAASSLRDCTTQLQQHTEKNGRVSEAWPRVYVYNWKFNWQLC